MNKKIIIFCIFLFLIFITSIAIAKQDPIVLPVSIDKTKMRDFLFPELVRHFPSILRENIDIDLNNIESIKDTGNHYKIKFTQDNRTITLIQSKRRTLQYLV